MNKLFLALVLVLTSAAASATEEMIAPDYAAAISYILDNGGYVDEGTLDSYNLFIYDSEIKDLRKFIKLRGTYGDNYDPKKDCRNPDLTMKQHAKECS